MDFIAFTRDLDFGGTSVLQCFPIGVTSKYKREVLLSCAEHWSLGLYFHLSGLFRIVDDDDIEINEDFFLDLISDDPAFGSSVPTAQIIILDDENSKM